MELGQYHVPMNLLTRYLLRQLLAPTLLALVAFAGAVWVSQALRFVDLIVNQGLSVLTFTYLTGLLIPSLVLVVLPFAAFIGALAGYSKLRAESELSVCRAAGLSDLQLARGALWLGVVFVLASYVVGLYVMPTAYRHFRTLQHDLSRDVSTLAIQTGVFTSPVNGLTLHVGGRTETGELVNLVVHDTRRPGTAVTLLADRGDLVRGDDGPILVLRDGSYQELHGDGTLSVVYFEDTTVDLTVRTDDQGGRIAKSRELYLGELWQARTEGDNDQNYRHLTVEAHERLSWPLVSLALPLIAATAVLRHRAVREQSWRTMAVSSGVAVAVVTLALTSVNLARNDLALVPLLYAVPLAPIVTCLALLTTARRVRVPRSARA
ncbi:MAG: LptF/LptG family permease [Pseudomonadota bacterium]